jgi:vacuolar-type H+-ATPase subunit H
VRLRRGRFGDLIDRQLDLFIHDNQDEIADARAKLAKHIAAPRDEAEELYGDYLDAVEVATEILADMRDEFARTLSATDAELYEHEFNAAGRKRFRAFALEIENR